MYQQKKTLVQLLSPNDNWQNSVVDDNSISHFKNQSSVDQDIEKCQDQFLLGNPSSYLQDPEQIHWRESQQMKKRFPQVTAPSIEFSQNSLSMSMFKREQSRVDEPDKKHKNYIEILQAKKQQEEQVNQVVEKEITELINELRKKDQLIKGLKVKLVKCDQEIYSLSARVGELEAVEANNTELLKLIQKKDDFFKSHKLLINDGVKQLEAKEKIIKDMQSTIRKLTEENEQLANSLAMYSQNNQNLLDFRQSTLHADPSRKNFNSTAQTRQLQKLKRDKANLENQLTLVSNRLQQKDNQNKTLQEQYKKKLAAKDKKITELENRVNSLRQDSSKGKAAIDSVLEKLNDTIDIQLRQANEKGEKIAEYERRMKTANDQFKRKDDKIKELSMEIIDKNRQLQEKNSECENLKANSSFEQHLVKQKEKTIDQLREEQKKLRQQLQSLQLKINQQAKSQKSIQNERTKRDRQIDYFKKQYETLMKQHQKIQSQLQNSEKESQQKSEQLLDLKRKYDQQIKKCSQMKAKTQTQQQNIVELTSQLTELNQQQKKATKDAAQLKKRIDQYPQMVNKISMLEARIKEMQSIQNIDKRDLSAFEESFDSRDKIEALQLRLSQKDKEIKMIKNQLRKATAASTNKPSQQLFHLQQQCKALQDQLQQKQSEIVFLESELVRIEQSYKQLEAQLQDKDRQIAFKENSLTYLHGVLLQKQKARIQLENQQKQHDMISYFEGNSLEDITLNYQRQIEYLKKKVESQENALRDKEEQLRKLNSKEAKDQAKFEIRQLKQRVKELSELALSKQRKFAPENLSQEETLDFLVKTLKKAVRSSEMLRVLCRSGDFRDCLVRFDKEFRGSIEKEFRG